MKTSLLEPGGQGAWKIAVFAIFVSVLFGFVSPVAASETTVRYFPAGPIYEYRWKLLELALSHVRTPGESLRFTPYTDDITQKLPQIPGIRVLRDGRFGPCGGHRCLHVLMLHCSEWMVKSIGRFERPLLPDPRS